MPTGARATVEIDRFSLAIDVIDRVPALKVAGAHAKYKGPTVSARLADLPLLAEVGLGVHRRLNEGRKGRSRPRLSATDTSFWYVADHLGQRFRTGAQEMLGTLEPDGPGVWRCRLLRHLVFFVSGADLPLEAESLPLHILSKQAKEREIARLMIDEPRLLEQFGEWAVSLHPQGS